MDSAICHRRRARFIMLASPGRCLTKIARARGVTLSGDRSRPVRNSAGSSRPGARIVADLREASPASTSHGCVGIRHVPCTPLWVVRYLENVSDPTRPIGVLH
jgi:hypothetical protein